MKLDSMAPAEKFMFDAVIQDFERDEVPSDAFPRNEAIPEGEGRDIAPLAERPAVDEPAGGFEIKEGNDEKEHDSENLEIWLNEIKLELIRIRETISDIAHWHAENTSRLLISQFVAMGAHFVERGTFRRLVAAIEEIHKVDPEMTISLPSQIDPNVRSEIRRQLEALGDQGVAIEDSRSDRTEFVSWSAGSIRYDWRSLASEIQGILRDLNLLHHHAEAETQ